MSELIFKTLQRTWPFDAAPHIRLRAIAASATLAPVTRDRLIFAKGDAADAVYVVLDGEVAIEILSPEGRSVTLSVLGANQVFGELAALDGGVRTAGARASANGRLIKIPKAVVAALAEEEPRVALALIRGLIGKLRTTDQQIEDIAFRPLKARVAMMLMTLAGGETIDAETTVAITQNALADRLSATREKVNLHLQALQQAGAVSLGRGKITIMKAGILRRIAAADGPE